MIKKRILIIDVNLPYLVNGVNYPVGGATVQTYNWMRGFEELGYKIHIGSSTNIENRSKYNIYDTGIRDSKFFIFKIIKTIYVLIGIIKKIEPDFVYISTPNWINIFVILSSLLSRVKTVQRISNDNLVDARSELRFGWKKNMIYKWTLKMSSLILCQNNYQYANIIKKHWYDKVMKLTNPFLMEKGTIISYDRSYVAWVGIFQHQKNMKALLKVAHELPYLNFKIAGKAYDNIDIETKDAIDSLKSLKNVDFVGLVSREDIPGFLSKAICLLNTSHYEGFSNTYLESFSVNTPIITRKETDPDSIIEDNNLGVIVSDYSEISQAITELIKGGKDYSHLKGYLYANHQPKILVKQLLNKLNLHDKTI